MTVEEHLVGIGFCSMTKAEKLIKEERVSDRDGILSKNSTYGGQAIFVDGEPVFATRNFEYFAFHKPENRVMAETVELSDELKPYLDIDTNARFLYKLDERTSGLTIITTNRELSFKMVFEREYRVKVKTSLTNSFFRDLKWPIFDKDGNEFSIIPRKDKNRQLFVTFAGDDSLLYERFIKLGNPIFELKCVRFGDIKLNELGPGNMRKLTKKERRFLES